jgi:hypothetical protein
MLLPLYARFTARRTPKGSKAPHVETEDAARFLPCFRAWVKGKLAHNQPENDLVGSIMRAIRNSFGCLLTVCSLAYALGGASTGNLPLNDLGAGFYQGFQGGLYPQGLNAPPAGHLQAAMNAAQQIVPRNAAGDPDPNGWIVLLSIGMSNTCHEFAVFERQEDLNADRNARVVIVNGAVGGWSAALIADPGAGYWQIVQDRLTALGLTPQQVQVVWLKEANQSPPDDFPGHATQLRNDLRTVVQNLHDKFPNARLSYLSSRTYGGYSVNWEPQAYETAFSVKWLIEDQINGADPGLNYGGQPGPVEAPLLLWGPYLWADGLTPRSDGLTWLQADFESDNTHPSPTGEQKVADLLSQFFAAAPTAQPWYAAQPGVSLVVVDAEADAYTSMAAPRANFGAALELQHQGGASPIRAYLRFDTSSVDSPILLAKLGLRVITNGGGGGVVSLVNDSSWGENTITLNNAPPVDGGAMASIPLSTRDGTVTANVTDPLLADGDGVVSMAFADATGGLRTYHSREAGQPPRLVLVVETTGPPIPATSAVGAVILTLALLMTGMVVVGRLRPFGCRQFRQPVGSAHEIRAR